MSLGKVLAAPTIAVKQDFFRDNDDPFRIDLLSRFKFREPDLDVLHW